SRQLFECKCADLQCRGDAFPWRVQELTAERILRCECNRMHESVEAVPTFGNLFDRGLDVTRFLHIHLENVRHRIELFCSHLGDSHHPAEAREQELCACFLQLRRYRVADAAAVTHAGEQHALAFEDHWRMLYEARPGTVDGSSPPMRPTASRATRGDPSGCAARSRSCPMRSLRCSELSTGVPATQSREWPLDRRIPRGGFPADPQGSAPVATGASRLDQSLHEPSYRRTFLTPASSIASRLWHALTPEPQYTTAPSSGSTPTSSKRRRSSSRGLNRPSSCRLPMNGALRAPGMWPALGSTGSFSPRYRSPARESITGTPRCRATSSKSRIRDRSGRRAVKLPSRMCGAAAS